MTQTLSMRGNNNNHEKYKNRKPYRDWINDCRTLHYGAYVIGDSNFTCTYFIDEPCIISGRHSTWNEEGTPYTNDQ